jgi:dihydrofolate reductase
MPKLVCSSTLETVSWNSRLVRGDIVDEIGAIRDGVDGDIHVGGPTLAAALVRRNLIDEYRMVVHPVAIGTGTPYLPTLEAPLRLRPTRTWAFEASGVRAYAYEPVRE